MFHRTTWSVGVTSCVRKHLGHGSRIGKSFFIERLLVTLTYETIEKDLDPNVLLSLYQTDKL